MRISLRSRRKENSFTHLSFSAKVVRPKDKETPNMHYVLMIHASESRYATMTPESIEASMQAYGQFTKDLFATGRAGDCAALESVQTATTVQIRDGKRMVKDGPFAEVREQLGGYYCFEAKAEEEAFAWAAKIPDALGGSIEVRPLVASTADAGAKNVAKEQKQYLLLIYEAESRWATLSPAEASAIFAGYRAFGASIKASGQYIAGEQLESTQKAKCVRNEGGKRHVKDGPFSETREQLGGYYRVFARNLDEAVEMACKLPAAETGTIEIRPVMDTSAYA
jgi:hypothetical protein